MDNHTVWAVGVVSAGVVGLAAWGLKVDRERVVADTVKALRLSSENETAIAVLENRAVADDEFKRETRAALLRLEAQNKDQLMLLGAVRAEMKRR